MTASRNIRKKRKPWTAAEIALLGTARDSEISRLLNRRIDVVAGKRRQLKKAHVFLRRPWAKEEDAMIASHIPTAKIAATTGRTIRAVQQRRVILRVSAPQLWTPGMDAILGTITDKAAADILKLPVSCVRGRRFRLGIPPSNTPIACRKCAKPFTPKAGAKNCPACRKASLREIRKRSRDKQRKAALADPVKHARLRALERRDNKMRDPAKKRAAAQRASAEKQRQRDLEILSNL